MNSLRGDADFGTPLAISPGIAGSYQKSRGAAGNSVRAPLQGVQKALLGEGVLKGESHETH